MRAGCSGRDAGQANIRKGDINLFLVCGSAPLDAAEFAAHAHLCPPQYRAVGVRIDGVDMGGKLGGVQWGTAADEQQVYVAVSDVRLAGVAPGTPGSQPTSFGFSLRLDPAVGGGLLALKIDTGEVVWKTPHPGCAAKPGCSPAQSAAVTAIPGVVFSGGLDGHLRGYAADNGQIIWDSDTKKSYTTVNGVVAQGGSLDGPGAVVVEGTV